MDPCASLCWSCFSTSGKIQNIFASNSETFEIKDTLLTCMPEIDFDENSSLYLCETCQLSLIGFEKFRLMFIKNMIILKSHMVRNDIHIHSNRIINEEENNLFSNSMKSLLASEEQKCIEDEGTVKVNEEILDEISETGKTETRIVFETLCMNENGEYDAVTVKEENLIVQDLGFCEMSTEQDNMSDTTLNRIDKLTYSITENEVTDQTNPISIDLTDSDVGITTNNINNDNLNNKRKLSQKESESENRFMSYNNQNNDRTSKVIKMTESTVVTSLTLNNKKSLILMKNMQVNGSCRISLEQLPVQDTVEIKDEDDAKVCEINGEHRNINDEMEMNPSIADAVITRRSTEHLPVQDTVEIKDEDDAKVCEINGEHRNIKDEMEMNPSFADAVITRRSTDNQISCIICNEKFGTLGELQKHKRRHNRIYECLKCNIQYRHLITYNVHKMEHIHKILKREMRKRSQKLQKQHRNKVKKRIARHDVIKQVNRVRNKENEKVVLVEEGERLVVDINDKSERIKEKKKEVLVEEGGRVGVDVNDNTIKIKEKTKKVLVEEGERLVVDINDKSERIKEKEKDVILEEGGRVGVDINDNRIKIKEKTKKVLVEEGRRVVVDINDKSERIKEKEKDVLLEEGERVGVDINDNRIKINEEENDVLMEEGRKLVVDTNDKSIGIKEKENDVSVEEERKLVVDINDKSVRIGENANEVLIEEKGRLVDINDILCDHPYAKKPIRCEACNISFNWEYNYKRHLAMFKYDCDRCEKHFYKPAMLALHKKRRCRGIVSYRCTKCDKNFAQRNHLNLHERAHFGLRTFKCNLCDVVMTRGDNIERHIAVKHAQANKTSHMYEIIEPGCYYCYICSELFENLHKLHIHQLLHTISKIPYSCKYCNKSYIRIYNLNNHKCPNFPANQEDTNTSASAATSSTVNEANPAYCTICKQQFASNYRIHARTHDTIDPTPTYSCRICSKKLGEKASLKQHNRSHAMLLRSSVTV